MASGQVDRVADQERLGAREDLPPVGSPCAARFAPPVAGCAARHFHHCRSEPALGPCAYPDAGLGVGVQQRSPAAIPKPRRLFSDPTMSLNNTVASMRSGAAGGRTRCGTRPLVQDLRGVRHTLPYDGKDKEGAVPADPDIVTPPA